MSTGHQALLQEQQRATEDTQPQHIRALLFLLSKPFFIPRISDDSSRQPVPLLPHC